MYAHPLNTRHVGDNLPCTKSEEMQRPFIDTTWPPGTEIPFFRPEDGADKLAEWVDGFLSHSEAKNKSIAIIYRAEDGKGNCEDFET